MEDTPQSTDLAPGGTTEGVVGNPTNVSGPEPTVGTPVQASEPGDPSVEVPPPNRPVESDSQTAPPPAEPLPAEPLPVDMTVAQSAASVAQVQASQADPDTPTLAPVPDMLLPAADLSDDEKNDLVIPLFQSHKRVRALKIAKVHFSTVAFEDVRFMARTMRDFVEKHKPESGGWYVVHNDGTEDYYPANFENDFHPVG